MSKRAPVELAVLLSGSGRTLQNLIDHIASGQVPGRIARVISSRAGVLGVDRSRDAGLETVVVPRRSFETEQAYNDAVVGVLDRAPVDLIVLAGYMHLFAIPEKYRGRVMNIHPALLPAFGGPGLYGERVHRAVLASSTRETGCTVHFCDQEFDHGPIILQRKVPVLPGDTVTTLARRVFFEECRAYPEAIRLFAEGRLKLQGAKVEIAAEEGAEG